MLEGEWPRQVQEVAIHARVSSAEHRAHLERQAERLVQYCEARGYQVTQVVQVIASGVNDSRPKLLALLKGTRITLLVVEQRDRLTRFGFHYLETLLETQGRSIEVVNVAENNKEELLADLVAILYSFTARLYGQSEPNIRRNALWQHWGLRMQLVEQYVISCTDSRYKAIDAAAFASKNLNNQATYQIRQAYLHEGKYLPYAAIFHQVKRLECYGALSAKFSNSILILIHKNWVSFFRAWEGWIEHPEKFTGRPKIPGYKPKEKGSNILIYDKQAIGVKADGNAGSS